LIQFGLCRGVLGSRLRRGLLVEFGLRRAASREPERETHTKSDP
jgi:hypothetical protein